MMGAEDNAELAKLNADYGVDGERAGRLVQGEKKKWLAGTLVGLIQVCVWQFGLWCVYTYM